MRGNLGGRPARGAAGQLPESQIADFLRRLVRRATRGGDARLGGATEHAVDGPGASARAGALARLVAAARGLAGPAVRRFFAGTRSVVGMCLTPLQPPVQRALVVVGHFVDGRAVEG